MYGIVSNVACDFIVNRRCILCMMLNDDVAWPCGEHKPRPMEVTPHDATCKVTLLLISWNPIVHVPSNTNKAEAYTFTS